VAEQLLASAAKGRSRLPADKIVVNMIARFFMLISPSLFFRLSLIFPGSPHPGTRQARLRKSG